jgi:hypothetical protein
MNNILDEDKLQEEIYNEIFTCAMDLHVKHYKNQNINQIVSSSMLAIAMRFYRTSLTSEEYLKFLNSVVEVGKEAKPFGVADIVPKKSLH